MRCDEYRIVDIGKYKHFPMCSQQRDVDYLKDAYKQLTNRFEQIQRSDNIRIKRLVEDVTRWHGKYLLVKEENNTLRRKISKQFRKE